jgi:hypothetical protein
MTLAHVPPILAGRTLGRTCRDAVRKRRRTLRQGPSGRQSDHMEAILLSLLLAAPWLVAIAWTWSRAPRMDTVPPSMGERMRERLASA